MNGNLLMIGQDEQLQELLEEVGFNVRHTDTSVTADEIDLILTTPGTSDKFQKRDLPVVVVPTCLSIRDFLGRVNEELMEQKERRFNAAIALAN